MKKETIKRRLGIIDKDFMELYKAYNNWHDDFDKFRGKPLSGEETQQVNEALTELKDIFINMSYINDFVTGRYKYVVETNNHFNAFITNTLNRAH